MTATAWIALVALAFAGSQTLIARRKLQFDLFAKRFETWDAYNEALNGRRDEIREGARAGDVTAQDKCQKEMWRQRRLMMALFPPEVHAALDAIEARLLEFASANVEAMFRDVGSPESGERAVARYQALEVADQRLWAAQGLLMSLAHRYIKQYGWWEQHATPKMRSVGDRAKTTWQRLRTRVSEPRDRQPD